MIEVLLRHGADVNARSLKDGRTALHFAASYGCDESAQALIAAGADVGATDNYGRTPLHHCGFIGAADVLVSHGADPLAKDSEGLTPLHTNRREHTLKYLLTLPGSGKEVAKEVAEFNEFLAKILGENAP